MQPNIKRKNENKGLVLLLIAMGAVFVMIAFASSFLLPSFTSSIEVNSTIVTVLLTSFVMVIMAAMSDKQAVQQFRVSLDSMDDDDALIASGGAKFLSILVKLKSGIGVHDGELNRVCVQELGKPMPYLGFISGSLVILGLIGTFVGLSSAVSDIGRIVSALGGEGDAYEKVTALFGSLAAPMEGMGTAFGTSLIGVLASLISGAINTLYSYTVELSADVIKGEVYLFQRNREIDLAPEVMGGGGGPGGSGGPGGTGGMTGMMSMRKTPEAEMDPKFSEAIKSLQNVSIEQRKYMDSLLAEHRTGMKVLLDQVESKRKINAAIAMNMESMTDSLTMQMTLMQEISTVGRHNNERLHALVSILEEFSTNYADRLARMLPNIQRIADSMEEQLGNISDLGEVRKIVEQQSRRLSDLGVVKNILEEQTGKIIALDRNQVERSRELRDSQVHNMERVENTLNAQFSKINEISEEFGTLVKIKYIAEQQLRKFSELTGKRFDNNVELSNAVNRVESSLGQVDSKLTGLSKFLLEE